MTGRLEGRDDGLGPHPLSPAELLERQREDRADDLYDPTNEDFL